MQNKHSLVFVLFLLGFSIFIPSLTSNEKDAEIRLQLPSQPSSNANFTLPRWVELLVCVDKQFIELHENDTLDAQGHAATVDVDGKVLDLTELYHVGDETPPMFDWWQNFHNSNQADSGIRKQFDFLWELMYKTS